MKLCRPLAWLAPCMPPRASDSTCFTLMLLPSALLRPCFGPVAGLYPPARCLHAPKTVQSSTELTQKELSPAVAPATAADAVFFPICTIYSPLAPSNIQHSQRPSAQQTCLRAGACADSRVFEGGEISSRRRNPQKKEKSRRGLGLSVHTTADGAVNIY